MILNRGKREKTKHVMRSRYYAIRPDHLDGLMKEAGFEQVRRMDDQSTHPTTLVGAKGG